MKPYMVEITTRAVVMAENEAHAQDVAKNYASEAVADDPNPRIAVPREAKSLRDLDHGWDGGCVPYGGDGNTRLSDLLTPTPTP